MVCNHNWKSQVHNFYKTPGCPRCNKSKGSKYTTEEVKAFVLKRGFKLLDNEYIRSNIPLNFQCLTCNYKWKAAFSNNKK